MGRAVVPEAPGAPGVAGPTVVGAPVRRADSPMVVGACVEMRARVMLATDALTGAPLVVERAAARQAVGWLLAATRLTAKAASSHSTLLARHSGSARRAPHP